MQDVVLVSPIRKRIVIIDINYEQIFCYFCNARESSFITEKAICFYRFNTLLVLYNISNALLRIVVILINIVYLDIVFFVLNGFLGVLKIFFVSFSSAQLS